MKLKRDAIFVFGFIFFIAVSAYVLDWRERALRENMLVELGNNIVIKIENFKTAKGKLPDKLSEAGVKEKEAGPIYYSKRTETQYILWFGTTLGESITYDSDTKKWH
jgi:hypothetical protein